MKCKLTNISFIDGDSKNQKYCFLVTLIEDGNVLFLGLRNYNFKKKMSLKTFSFIYEDYSRRPDKYISGIQRFDYLINDNSIFFTIMNLIDLKADARSPIRFKIRDL